MHAAAIPGAEVAFRVNGQDLPEHRNPLFAMDEETGGVVSALMQRRRIVSSYIEAPVGQQYAMHLLVDKDFLPAQETRP